MERIQKLVLLLVTSVSCVFPATEERDIARWEQKARQVTIIRDDWGIAH
ncbi:MAG: hypothetical protein JOY85_10730, partial [Acidobacteriaceae bacterium]|nr:hypothetical protein [Acidobacteriaceae bacterium]